MFQPPVEVLPSGQYRSGERRCTAHFKLDRYLALGAAGGDPDTPPLVAAALFNYLTTYQRRVRGLLYRRGSG